MSIENELNRNRAKNIMIAICRISILSGVCFWQLLLSVIGVWFHLTANRIAAKQSLMSKCTGCFGIKIDSISTIAVFLGLIGHLPNIIKESMCSILVCHLSHSSNLFGKPSNKFASNCVRAIIVRLVPKKVEELMEIFEPFERIVLK